MLSQQRRQPTHVPGEDNGTWCEGCRTSVHPDFHCFTPFSPLLPPGGTWPTTPLPLTSALRALPRLRPHAVLQPLSGHTSTSFRLRHLGPSSCLWLLTPTQTSSPPSAGDTLPQCPTCHSRGRPPSAHTLLKLLQSLAPHSPHLPQLPLSFHAAPSPLIGHALHPNFAKMPPASCSWLTPSRLPPAPVCAGLLCAFHAVALVLKCRGTNKRREKRRKERGGSFRTNKHLQ